MAESEEKYKERPFIDSWFLVAACHVVGERDRFPGCPAVCRASHTRAVPTPAASSLNAKLGDKRACSWTTRLKVTLDTPKRSAASAIEISSSDKTSSRKIAPG